MLEPTRPARPRNVYGGEGRKKPNPIEGLVRRKKDLERALTETREALANGVIGKAIDERLRLLSREQLQRPRTGATGSVVTRVLGHRPSGKRKKNRGIFIPLPGLEAELRLGGKMAASGRTGHSGVVTLPFPEDFKGGYEVTVLAPDCTVVGCHRGRLTGSRDPTVLLTVGYQSALAPAFDRGLVWQQATERARARAVELKKKVKKALTNQRRAIEKALVELDELIACP